MPLLADARCYVELGLAVVSHAPEWVTSWQLGNHFPACRGLSRRGKNDRDLHRRKRPLLAGKEATRSNYKKMPYSHIVGFRQKYHHKPTNLLKGDDNSSLLWKTVRIIHQVGVIWVKTSNIEELLSIQLTFKIIRIASDKLMRYLSKLTPHTDKHCD